MQLLVEIATVTKELATVSGVRFKSKYWGRGKEGG